MVGERQLASELVLLSSFVHASWNLAARAVKGNTAVLVLGVCGVAPVFLATGALAQASLADDQPQYARQMEAGWVYLLITGVAHAVYLLLLAHSYKIGDLSIVYPVSRGSSVVFVAVFSRLIVAHYTISPVGQIGIVLVLGGIGAMAVKGQSLLPKQCCRRGQLVRYASVDNDPATEIESDIGQNARTSSKPAAQAADSHTGSMSQREIWVALAFALAVGACTAVYSIDDSVGVTVVDPLLYQLGNCTLMLCICLPLMLSSSQQRSAMVEAVHTKKKYIVGIGVGGAGTYLVVLYAFRLADNAPYVVVLRQSSIVFATILGVVLLKEVLSLPKIIGVVMITTGVAVIEFSDGNP